MGFSNQTIVTDLLSAIGFIILILGPFLYLIGYNKFFSRNLFNSEDGKKIFEKLKYDLKVDKIENINKNRFYRDLDYALTIFKNSMEYNKRDLIFYFNERKASKMLKSTLSKMAWLSFLVWAIFFTVSFSSSGLDIIFFIFNGLERNSSANGYSSIVFLFIIIVIFNSIIFTAKLYFFQKKINLEIKKINPNKIEKLKSNFVYVYAGEIGLYIMALTFIFINSFF
ncbi:hypothetical protein SSABA_v1c03170 [Spiroplasma sabaudiense Ar-1343]|uniref:Transmembrane protein n=1 Tax=Spiroplasma sabaudiense Ar-1343 TaxID=1276257 RepID=W6AJ46_9MOLU|nr:hypothetical protein [Spiroplasma sabaudiense]AHI53729.1 hypothetical protein SSABA_v1c03170 [Spiroplasma sabaudiense Ar-1343]